jgi:hypothetical protein
MNAAISLCHSPDLSCEERYEAAHSHCREKTTSPSVVLGNENDMALGRRGLTR